jgi:hypothetical protein
MPELGGVHGRIEFDQHVASIDPLPVAHVDRPHDARLERLDDLGAAAGNDLAGGDRHDIDRADAGPGQGDGEHGNDADADGAADRRRRRLDDFERRRQKRELVLLVTVALVWKLDDILSRLHAALPASGRGPHTDRPA